MKRLLTGALALSLLTGTAAMAQSDRQDQRGYDQRSSDQRNSDQRGADQRGSDQRGDNQRGSDWRGSDQRAEGHHWGRGERMPAEYYRDSSHYVDYRTYHLRRPPHGYRWVRTDDNNFALVAITSGLIASIIAASR
jgi:Ni/Co efflux regulator RcnB